MSELRFDGRVAVITGAGGGLGKAYSKFYASRGAKIVVNDLNKENADACVKEIKDAGGEALANYNSVLDGDQIVKQAMDKYGQIDILINNAGILRDKSFKSMTDKEWDTIHDIHVRGAYAITHAAWPIFRKQKYGRIINTASAAGIYGNFGQANYSAAKFALISFAKSLAREGAKYNITANAIAPIAASQMTETIMPPEMLENLKPELFIPLVIFLTHEDTDVTGQLFEGGAGWFGQLRWQRSKGVVFKTDETFTPSAVKAKFEDIVDFERGSDFPASLTDTDYLALLEAAKAAKSNPQADQEVRFDGQTAVVTGAGGGLGRAYALMFGRGGANVVVNDFNKEAAQKVVEEIKKHGGKAVANTASVVDGEAVVKTAIDTFGGVHILINNAGILRDKSFASMTDKEWDDVYQVHVKGSYATCKAVWPIFQQQKYGRIVNTTSVVGLHGNFGQCNYSTAKGAIIGFTQTLAIEGKKYNILANIMTPNAGTAMTATIWPEEMVKAFSPDYVAPLVGYLSSKDNTFTRGIFEASGGWLAHTRWQRTKGYAFPHNKPTTPEKVKAKYSVISRYDEDATNPQSTMESNESIMGNFGNDEEGEDEEGGSEGLEDFTDPEDSDLVAKAKKQPIDDYEYSYTEKDVILYNLGIGALETQLKYTFEGDSDFMALPTFGVIPQFGASSNVPFDWLPNFSPMMLLHGEQYLKIYDEIPTSGNMVTKTQLAEVLDKGKAAAVTACMKTINKDTGKLLFENTSTLFIRGSGGFGGRKSAKDRGAITAPNKPPSRKPDAEVEEQTLKRQAAIYRLSGDGNPLHIDPDFASVGGFERPILHGLCSFGIAGKAIVESFGPITDIKVRFAGILTPGETLVTSMWKEGDRVIFTAKCKERDAAVLAAGGATLAKA